MTPSWIRSARALVAAVSGITAGGALHRTALADGVPKPAPQEDRFKTVASGCADQVYKPPAPYPQWDSNWDRRNLTLKQVERLLGHEGLTDLPTMIRKLYADHTDVPAAKVEEMIAECKDDTRALVQHYKTAFLTHAYGGGVTRHIILVRHGQYDETYNRSKYFFPRDDPWDHKRFLTELGEQQAARTGDRLAEILAPALTTPGREAHVRLHSSGMTRARQTADIIATKLPAHIPRSAPDPRLNEAYPAHMIPGSREGDAEEIHTEAPRIESAFRWYFHRADPPGSPAPPLTPPKADDTKQQADALIEEADRKSKTRREHRHEYDIIVCHCNVIRFFVLRALQLPPEAWLRMGGFNCSLTHLTIRPNGGVSLIAFGDAGHLSYEDTTFSMRQGFEYK